MVKKEDKKSLLDTATGLIDIKITANVKSNM